TMKYSFFPPSIATATTLKEAREAVNDASEELSLMGSLCFLKKLEERDEQVTAVLGFYTEGRVHTPLQHFSLYVVSIIYATNLQIFFLWFADGASQLSLGDILIFSTGLDKIPAMGFPTQPELEFLHPEDGPAMFPMANTCGPVLRLPVQPTFPKFESAMEMGIGGAIQFGIH
uniref:HECT domain-containing protein n=1 Tax=Scophthalmus maximus TaxID=52904 RepID=A0A8D3E228_SCOMX